MEKGDRIKLISMPNDPDPVPAGTEGTVRLVHRVYDYVQISVDWDNGRSLGLVIPPDVVQLIGMKEANDGSE